MQAAGCALSCWFYPIKNVIKERTILLDEEVAKVFILKNCLNRILVRNLLPAKPSKRLVKSCLNIS